jgi:hypothetical protein
MVPAHLNAVQMKDRVRGSMPKQFNIEKIRQEQQKRRKNKAKREEEVWEPPIDGFPSDGKNLLLRNPSRQIGSQRYSRVINMVMTQVHLFAPAH